MDKNELRMAIRSRGPVAPETSLQVVEELFAWMSQRLPGTVSAFLPMPGEVDLRPLFARLPGWRWVLPRVEPDRSLTFRDRNVPTERHSLGMDQPADIGPVVPFHEIDLFLTPGLAFDRAGGRLGKGGGFYDEVLARSRTDAVAVGITIEDRVVEKVPMHNHDQRVDWLATETGVTRCMPRN